MSEDCCPNCQALLHGPYCSACGQRMPRPDEYSTLGFLADAATEIFSVDGKTFRTARQLLLHPGRLTLDYYQGRRIQYLKPIQLFLIVNVIFLLIAIGNGLFDFSLEEYMGFGTPSNRQLVTQAIARQGISFEAYAAAFDHNEEILRKSLIFLLAPLFAIVVWMLYYRSRRYYAEHLVFSIHFFSFFWLFTTCAGLPVAFLAARAGIRPDNVLLPFIEISTLVYLYLMLRTVYAQGRLITLARAFVCLAAVYALLDAYRILLFFGTYLIT
jgi:hypothetical protein